MKKIILPILLANSLFFTGCAEMQTIANQLPNVYGTSGTNVGGLSQTTIAAGLKEALHLGVDQGIAKLGQTNGFYNSPLAKILLPEELQGVERSLRNLGLGSLVEEGLKLLNRAAEDAVLEAKPIFVNAITGMTIQDAGAILLGGQNAATNYLQSKTSPQLFSAFQPKVQHSLEKVGAHRVWENIITKYNTISTNKINPDLTAYVTEQAITGVFRMVAEKEAGIRGNISQRTTPLLQQVFALQDNR
ncbi:DUF4197 domain-containing protein [Vaginella massiliensis]|uniref:DUF4197 domain-containing protein n=1 Tax=Vaginella massiliensis TaxID=1816680 RepID=UPI003750E182